MTQELGRVPSLDEVASDMKISRKRAERALRCVRSDLSLESPLDAQGEQSLIQVLEAEEAEPDQQVMDRDQLEMVNESLDSTLDSREADVIRAYFGLDGEERRTLGEIGLGLGVTRERVRQIRNRALAKLQRFFRQRVSGGTWKDLI